MHPVLEQLISNSVTVDSGQTITGTGGLTMASNINLNSNQLTIYLTHS